jgi:Arc/MetJ family transcription regulator
VIGAKCKNTHQEVYTMRTNIVLDKSLIEEAMRCAGSRTKRETVDLALREFVARRRQRAVLALAGKDLIDPDYDVRAIRRDMRNGAG